jgi:hypothetical protein
MIKKILFIYLFLLIACKSEKLKEKIPVPNKIEINEIVKAIVSQDSLYAQDILLSQDLRKIKISTRPHTIIQSPIDINSINIKELMVVKSNNQHFFSKSDSSYILSQNDTMRTFQIDKILSKRIKLTTSIEQGKKRKSGNPISFYDITIPIFSLDQKVAFVELTHNCSGLCGKAIAIFLEKINGKWIIVKQKMLWIS